MENDFSAIKPRRIEGNSFNLVAREWMLITAGTRTSFNTMTASWGGFGHLWNRDICWCVIRPQRYTYEFAERSSRFTLSFFDREYRDALKYCGTHSGRDVDKMAETGLTPTETPDGSVYFEEARLVIECEKIYLHDIDPSNFLDPDIHNEYPDKDYHRMYLGRIVRCLRR